MKKEKTIMHLKSATGFEVRVQLKSDSKLYIECRYTHASAPDSDRDWFRADDASSEYPAYSVSKANQACIDACAAMQLHFEFEIENGSKDVLQSEV